MQRFLLCVFSSSCLLVLAQAVACEEAAARGERADARSARALLARIHRHRHETWRLQRLMGKRRTPTTYSARRSPGPRYRRWVLRLWRKRALRARRQATSPPRKAAWLCIQRYEAEWDDGSAPYYGGLQMDLAFQRLYGADLLRRKGTADRWTPLEQMWVAERAYRSGRGFWPWPNSARACALV